MKSFNISDLFLTSWSQLNADQAAMVLLYKVQLEKNIQEGNIKKAGYNRYSLIRLLARKPEILKSLSADQVFDITEDFKFLEKPFYFFHVTRIHAGDVRLARPEEYLSSLTFYQFIKADSEYSKYAVLDFKNSPEKKHALNRLIAILYQPVPGKFNEDDIEEYAHILPRRLSMDLKFLILRTYLNCRTYIVETRCQNLFPVPEDSGNNEPQYLGPMWQDLMYDLSDTPAFMGLHLTKNAKLYEALDYLEKKAKDKPTVNA